MRWVAQLPRRGGAAASVRPGAAGAGNRRPDPFRAGTTERGRLARRQGPAGWRPHDQHNDERLNAHVAGKIRVHELAKELGLTNKEALDLAIALGIGVKSHSSSIEEAQGDRVRRRATVAGA